MDFFGSLHVNRHGRYHLGVARSRLVLALSAALAGAVGAVALATTQTQEISQNPETPETSESLGERMGINEGVSVPKRLIEREGLGLPELAPLLQADATAVRSTGARWVRLVSSNHPFTSQAAFAGFEAMDQWVMAVQDEGLDAVVVLSPWSGTATALETSVYRVDDEPSWFAWVGSMVERYDGDGVDDMPGLLRAIRHWEVDNEPDLKNSLAPRGADLDPTNFCTVEEYLHVLRLTSQAIRQADPSAKILNGGIYRPHRPHGQRYLEDIMAGAGDSIDIVSVHAYPNDLRGFERAVDNALAAAGDKPLWITETSVSSTDDEAWHAEMLESMVTLAFERGVEKLFWHSLNDPPKRAQRRVGMSQHSLYHYGMVPKPAVEVWMRLASGSP